MAAPGTDPFAELAFRRLPLAALLGLAGAAIVLGPGWSARFAAWPWLFSLVCVGLAHGAADLAVACRSRRRRALAPLAIGYLAIMATVAGAFVAAPAAVLAVFAALSVWHFGAAHAEGERPAAVVSRPPFRAIAGAAVACGGIAIGVPLAAWPAEAARVASEVTALAGRPATFDADDMRRAGFGLLVAAGLAGACEVVRLGRSGAGRRRLGRRAVELAVIGLLATVTDPLFSVGVYFLCWHAWREMRPLTAAVGGGEPRGFGPLGAALVRIHAAAMPLLLPTWAALVALWWLLPADALARSPRGLAVLSLAVYVVVTPSHEFLADVVRSRGAGSTRAPLRGGRRAPRVAA
jgi:Brp/Blh family beta-carotene 15,15'-monooxygenase